MHAMCINRLLKFYSVGAIRQRNAPQNAHLPHVNRAFSAHFALSRTRLSKFQQSVKATLVKPARQELKLESHHSTRPIP